MDVKVDQFSDSWIGTDRVSRKYLKWPHLGPLFWIDSIFCVEKTSCLNGHILVMRTLHSGSFRVAFSTFRNIRFCCKASQITVSVSSNAWFSSCSGVYRISQKKMRLGFKLTFVHFPRTFKSHHHHIKTKHKIHSIVILRFRRFSWITF